VSYADGFRGKVTLGDHEVASLIKLDDGSSVGLHLRLKGLMFLELALWGERRHVSMAKTTMDRTDIPGEGSRIMMY
jgi:hypothetical protein